MIGAFALEMVPEYDVVIQRIARALNPGGKLALLGLKHPDQWPDWLIHLGSWLNWESLQYYMKIIAYQELYFGAIYRCIGEAIKSLSEN